MKELERKRNIKIFIIGWSLFLIIVFLFLVWNDTHISKFSFDYDLLQSINDGYETQIEQVKYKKDDISITKDPIIISGWFIKNGVGTEHDVAMKVVLKNIATDQFYLIPTQMHERNDVTEFFSDNNNYKNSGFSINISRNQTVDIDSYDYEIYILYCINGEKNLVSLDTTIKTWENQNDT